MLVVGEAKRGKSTLINALLGRQLLPVGVVPVTAVDTTVTRGVPERLEVVFRDGRVAAVPLADLGEYVDESRNPGNRLAVARVTAYVDATLCRDGLLRGGIGQSGILREGIELVDTPGTGSVHDHDHVTRRALRTMDAALLVLTADPPMSASERALLGEVAELAVRTFVVVNKVDQLDPDDQATVMTFVRDQTAAILTSPPEVFGCSAREALRTRLDPISAGSIRSADGIATLESALMHYLATDRAGGLAESVRRKAVVLIDQNSDRLRIRIGLAEVERGEAEATVASFRLRLAEVHEHRRDALDLIGAEVRRLLAELNSAAAEAERDLAGRAVVAAERWIEGPGAQLGPRELSELGRRQLVAVIRELIDEWRGDWQARLESGLRRVEERQLADLATDLAAVAAAAEKSLGVQLSAEPDCGRLVDDPRFSYEWREQIGWSELVTDTLRRRLGGRRLAVRELLAETDRLTRQQVGRCRADFQSRLESSARELSRAAAVRFEQATATIDGALAESIRDRAVADDDTRDIIAVLGPRLRELQALRAELAR